MSRVLESTHKARKRHDCDSCGRDILPGDVYCRTRFGSRARKFEADTGRRHVDPECYDDELDEMYMEFVLEEEDVAVPVRVVYKVERKILLTQDGRQVERTEYAPVLVFGADEDSTPQAPKAKWYPTEDEPF